MLISTHEATQWFPTRAGLLRYARNRRRKVQPEKCNPKTWCPGAGLNHRHCDFQSHALPTELPGHGLGQAPEAASVWQSERRLSSAKTSYHKQITDHGGGRLLRCARNDSAGRKRKLIIMARLTFRRHCEEHSDEATQEWRNPLGCFAALAMTAREGCFAALAMTAWGESAS